MIRNYFKIAWRSLIKNRLYAAVNILGLFAGIVFALLIGSYVWQEIQVNHNIKNAENQYLLTSQWTDPNRGVDFTTLGPLAKTLKDDYPHLVANYYRWDGINSVVSKGDKNFREGVQLGDKSLVEQFGFDLMHGDPATVFEEPYSVLIKPEKALKYFGRFDVVGETLKMQNNGGETHDFKITGVLAAQGENSVTHLNDNNNNGFFVAKNTAQYFERGDLENWDLSIFPSYVELEKGVTAEDLSLPLREILKRHTSEDIQKNLIIKPIKLTDYFLEKDNALVKRMLYTLSYIGLFIVLMAMMNFVNIAISHSGSRMREIGIRKVLGGQRKQLIVQFLTESIALVTAAMVLAIVAYPFLRPWFGQLIGKEIIPLAEFPISFALIPFAIVLVIGLLAGLYPAFVLSSLKSIDSLKGKLKMNGQGVILRKALVGFQFTVALVVLIATLLVTQQVDYFFGKNLGYNKEYLISAAVPRDWTDAGTQKMLSLRDQFASLPEVKDVSLSYEIPNGNNGFQLPIYSAGQNPETAHSTQAFVADEYFLETYQIPLLAGSIFNRNTKDANSVIINKMAMESYGFKTAQEAVGQQIHVKGEDDPLIILGVVGDFHFESLHKQIKPQAFFNVSAMFTYRFLSFKLQPGNIETGLTALQQKWSSLLPGSAFEYKFMDDTLGKLYSNEIQMKKAAYTSTGLALIIVLLGIFGLVSLSIQKRIKEIGIRKVLGASVPNISVLFVKEFAMILAVSIAVACPLAYLMMQGWLDDYAYRIKIGGEPFIWAISIIGVITLVLIVLQTLKTAIANPVKSLRTE